MGIFGLKMPFSGPIESGSFSTPKPSFPDFGDFDPCTGPTRSQCLSDIFYLFVSTLSAGFGVLSTGFGV